MKYNSHKIINYILTKMAVILYLLIFTIIIIIIAIITSMIGTLGAIITLSNIIHQYIKNMISISNTLTHTLATKDKS